jgi:hypothetical protein
MTRNNFNHKKISRILAASFLLFSTAVLLSSSTVQYAAAAQCPLQGGVPKCYATHNFYPSSPLYSNGLKSTYKVYDNVINNQYVVSSTWAILTNGKIMEVAWRDGQGSSAHPYFVCAVDGWTQSTWGSPSHGSTWTFRSHDQNKDNIWTMAVDGSSSCSANGSTTTSNSLKTGYETSYDTNTITKNDYSNLQFVRDNIWYLWQSSYGVHGKTEQGTGFYVKYCGSGAENYYHSQHGKGTPPTSCT